MSLGILPELEFDCTPQLGELVVSWVNGNDQTVGLSARVGGPVESTHGWASLLYATGRPRRHEPMSRRPSPGDIVKVAP